MNEGPFRIRDIGINPGVMAPGPLNAITDVIGVCVGHATRIEGESTRTGVTAILPHSGNLFAERVPAGLAVGNGHGKLAGGTQLVELGEIETPIVLVNTLAVGRAVEAVVDWTLAQPGNEYIRSVNAVVAETNDGMLNDIRQRGLVAADVTAAIDGATGGPVPEGSVGAGTGTVAFDWKGGIGTSSRALPPSLGGWTVGALVQANHGGVLQIDGRPIGKALGRYHLKDAIDTGSADGSIVVIVATDAPLSDRNLTRLARRAMFGVARTGSTFANGSGDYAIAFSTHSGVRRTDATRSGVSNFEELGNDAMSPLFAAAIEAAEEAVYNALIAATPIESLDVLRAAMVRVDPLTVAEIDRAGGA